MRLGSLALTALLLAFPLTACSTENVGSAFRSALATRPGTVDSGEAAALISRYRVSRGLPPVTVDPALTKIAADHARRMAAADKMAHVLPGEGSFQLRLTAGNFDAATAAENVAAGQGTLAEALESWRKSPGHNANLLLAGATKIGIAVAVAEDGKYKTYWSLLLGERYVPKPGMVRDGPNAGPFLVGPGTTLEIGGN